jgi:hypothetical protein
MSDLTHISKCRLCGHEFKARAMEVPIIGEPPSAKLQKLLTGVFQHLALKHGDHPHFQALMGFAILACIDSPDPAVQQAQFTARHDMHRRTVDPKWGPKPFPDEVLNDAVTSVGLDADNHAAVMRLVTEVRDALLGEGQFAPVVPETPSMISSE